MNVFKSLFSPREDKSDEVVQSMKQEINKVAKRVIVNKQQLQGHITRDILYAMGVK